MASYFFFYSEMKSNVFFCFFFLIKRYVWMQCLHRYQKAKIDCLSFVMCPLLAQLIIAFFCCGRLQYYFSKQGRRYAPLSSLYILRCLWMLDYLFFSLLVKKKFCKSLDRHNWIKWDQKLKFWSKFIQSFFKLHHFGTNEKMFTTTKWCSLRKGE